MGAGKDIVLFVYLFILLACWRYVCVTRTGDGLDGGGVSFGIEVGWLVTPSIQNRKICKEIGLARML